MLFIALLLTNKGLHKLVLLVTTKIPYQEKEKSLSLLPVDLRLMLILMVL